MRAALLNDDWWRKLERWEIRKDGKALVWYSGMIEIELVSSWTDEEIEGIRVMDDRSDTRIGLPILGELLCRSIKELDT